MPSSYWAEGASCGQEKLLGHLMSSLFGADIVVSHLSKEASTEAQNRSEVGGRARLRACVCNNAISALLYAPATRPAGARGSSSRQLDVDTPGRTARPALTGVACTRNIFQALARPLGLSVRDDRE
jgi:hypothetical protein